MNMRMDRRRLFQASGLFAAVAAAPELVKRAAAQEPGARIRKAVGWGMIDHSLPVEERFRLVKDVGFEGVEVTRHSREEETDPRVLARASEKVGIPVHGVVNGTHPDLQAAIDDAEIYGATTVLHVARSDADASYMDNYRRTQELIRAAIPYAEKKRVKILVENVWATFLIEPLSMARYLDELGSPWVKAYFDVGNVMRWGWPQQWIEVLGSRIDKIHLKEYSLKVAMKEGMIKAFDFPIGQGDINWKRVREELEKIRFRDWATAEVAGGDRQKLADIAAQMDRVLYA
jgi:L-ribulose-5-phosphate 3-epimerase